MEKQRWLDVRITEYYYVSEEDKNDPSIKPIPIEVPFYASTLPLHEILLTYATATGKYCYDSNSFPWSPAPTPNCIGDVSLWESIFQFSICLLCIFM